MKEQFRWGRRRYISFILLDIVCLVVANLSAVLLYHGIGEKSYALSDYMMAVITMIVVDVVVTIVFNTLNRVLRRRKKTEVIQSLRHVVISFVILAVILFSTKQGAEYSRLTVYFAYALYFFFIVLARIIWKEILKRLRENHKIPTVLIITTSGYIAEGINALRNSFVIKGLFVTDKTNEGSAEGIPIIVDSHDALSFICWMMIDQVFICGAENIDVSESVLKACSQMGIPVHTAPIEKRFEYETVKIRTVLQKDDPSSGLSFFEGEHDIPFRISRLYTIFESEQNNQNGYHPHNQSWHLLFCPFGAINVYIDTGKEQKHVLLDNPSTGLILHPSIWREMTWKKPGSVLCVAASDRYSADELLTDHDVYLKFLKKKEWSAVVESSVIMGEKMA